MKGLRKVLTPFAPDQSGAVSVLYALGGMIVVLDAGGCTGNICGFDEPRWLREKSAIFSAGLRDMDAIFGQDAALIEKINYAAGQMDASFIALIGTPVPAVIGTDYQGLKRAVKKKLKLPVLAIASNGMTLYDRGIEQTWLELVKTLCTDAAAERHGIGVIGASPMDFSEKFFTTLPAISTVSQIKALAGVRKNIVVSPAGRKAADCLKTQFGVPYTCDIPREMMAGVVLPNVATGARVIVVHQQYIANAMRRLLPDTSAVTVASWFMMDEDQCMPGDVQLKEEDDFTALVARDKADVVIADAALKPLLPVDFDGDFIDFPHFALSGRTGA